MKSNAVTFIIIFCNDDLIITLHFVMTVIVINFKRYSGYTTVGKVTLKRVVRKVRAD